MFSFRPMRKQKTGRWDYCALDHFGNAEPVGCCQEHWESGNKEGHHATAAEAIKAFKEYLDPILRLDGTSFIANECAICKAPTFRGAVLDDGTHGEPILIASLCKTHLTKDAVLSLITEEPFETAQETFDKEKRLSDDADPDEHLKQDPNDIR